MTTNRRQFIKLWALGLGAFLLGPGEALSRRDTARRRWPGVLPGGEGREPASHPAVSGAAQMVGRLFVCADDGQNSCVWLADEMAKRGLVGSLFVPTRQVGRQGRLSWADIDRLGRQMDICSHGAVGARYTDLGDDDLMDYLVSARLDLEAHGRGRDARVFGPPNDDMDSRVRDAALAAGYELIRSKTVYRVLPGIAEFQMYGVANEKSEAFLERWLEWCAAGPATRGLALVFHRIVATNPVGTQCDEARARWVLDRAAESPCPKLRFTDLFDLEPPVEPTKQASAYLPLGWTER